MPVSRSGFFYDWGSSKRNEAYSKELESQETPQYELVRARYQLKTHMLESLDPYVLDNLGADLFWDCLERGGTMAVYNECLEKGCTVAQLFGRDDEWGDYDSDLDYYGVDHDSKPTIESLCDNDPQLIKDYITMLEMEIDFYDGAESFDDLDREKLDALIKFRDELRERIYNTEE